MERHPGEALGGFCATIGTFGIPIGLPFIQFFDKNADPKRKPTKIQIFECAVAGRPGPVMSLSDMFLGLVRKMVKHARTQS